MRIMFLLSQLELKSRSFYPFRLLLFISVLPQTSIYLFFSDPST